MKTIPACFFPTKVLLIDDDSDVLEEIHQTLDTTGATYETFSNPFNALNYLEKCYTKGSYLDTWLGDGHKRIQDNDYSWRNQIYTAERFEQVSVVVVDHTMPGINGLDLCEKIQSPHIQKIMLTGEADDAIAVNAFNEGIIHGFVKKSDPKIFSILNAMIHKRQIAFFNSLTRPIFEGAKEDFYGTLLEAPEFIEIFQTITKQFNTVEYYLMDSVGKFLLLDAMGNLSALYAYHEEEHSAAMPHMAAEGYFSNGTEFMFPITPVAHPLTHLRNRNVGYVNGQEADPHHNFPIYALPGHEKYTWGYIPKLVSLQKIISFNDYQNL